MTLAVRGRMPITAWLMTDFAGAGFADQRRYLAWQNAQIGAFDRLDPASEQREGDAQILDTQQVCT